MTEVLTAAAVSEAAGSAALVVDQEWRVLRVGNASVRMTAQEFSVFMALDGRRDSFVSHDRLRASLAEGASRGAAERDGAPLRVIVCRLRAKLRAIGSPWQVCNAWGAGYGLIRL